MNLSKTKQLWFAALGLALSVASCTQPAAETKTTTAPPTDVSAKTDGKYEENWESLKQVNDEPEWFKDAKFGIYTHWGPTAVAFEHMKGDDDMHGWHGMLMYHDQGFMDWQTGVAKDPTKPSQNYLYHKKHFGEPKEHGYKEIIKAFKPTKFNAVEWADLFKKSGARFAGPVAMHHDNFAMWDAKSTRWNSRNYGGIDPSADLKKEIESRGMHFMASFHHAFTWKFFAEAHRHDATEETSDLYTDNKEFASNEFSDRFLTEWWAKLKEYIDVYQPELLWFDWWLENLPEAERKKFLAYYYNKGKEWGKDVAVCYKESTFPAETAIHDYERGRPNQPQEEFWLTDTSPGAWFFRPNAKFVEPNELVDILIDIVSKNGCMLLNIPPNPDGSIPTEITHLLTEMGAWLDINGEAIYDTRVWTIFGEGPTRLEAGGHKIEEKGKIEYTDTDIRYTKGKNNTLFASVMDTPKGDIVMKSLSTAIGALNNDIEKITLLGSDEEIKWERTAEGLVIKKPASYPTKYAHCFKLQLKGYHETNIDGQM